MWRPLVTPTLIISGGIAYWGNTYESTTPTTRSDGGDRSERVQAISSGCCAARKHGIIVLILKTCQKVGVFDTFSG